MNVLVFGATGGTGRELVRQAIAQRHFVTAFARDISKLDAGDPNLIVTQGDVSNLESVIRAVRNQHAVFSTLGSSNSLKKNPTLIAGVRNIINAMKQIRVNRLVYLSVLGIGNSLGQLSFLDKYIIVPLILRNVVATHEANEKLIMESRLDWTIIRPPRLTNGKHTGKYRNGENIKSKSIFPSISRADVADFMLKQLIDDANLHKTPAVMY